MENKLILIGGGGHCKSCIDVIEQEGHFDIIGILDVPDRSSVLGYNVIGSDNAIKYWVDQGAWFLITVGQIQSPAIRQAIHDNLFEYQAQMATVISPLAYVSKYASIAPGTIIMHGAIINAGATIGCNNIVNTNALVEHDVVIEDHCHISTAAVVNGGCLIRRGTFFGSNAVSKEYVEANVGDFIKAGTLFNGRKIKVEYK